MPKPPKDDDKLPDAEAEDRFKRLVGNLVNTPHKPHKAPTNEDAPGIGDARGPNRAARGRPAKGR